MTLLVTRVVDREAQTVTLRVDDQGTDSEFNGRPCYAAEIDDPRVKNDLALLGFEHIGCKLAPSGSPLGRRHIEYWARRGTGGQT